MQYRRIDDLQEVFYDLIEIIEMGLCAGFTTQCYSAQVGSIIRGHQCHQLWTHLFFIYGRGNFVAPNCHSAIRIFTTRINHFHYTGITNTAFTRRATQLTSHQKLLLPTELSNQGNCQQSDLSSSFVPCSLLIHIINISLRWEQFPFKACDLSTTLMWKSTETDILIIGAWRMGIINH